jgi:hypothetical protein
LSGVLPLPAFLAQVPVVRTLRTLIPALGVVSLLLGREARAEEGEGGAATYGYSSADSLPEAAQGRERMGMPGM